MRFALACQNRLRLLYTHAEAKVSDTNHVGGVSGVDGVSFGLTPQRLRVYARTGACTRKVNLTPLTPSKPPSYCDVRSWPAGLEAGLGYFGGDSNPAAW